MTEKKSWAPSWRVDKLRRVCCHWVNFLLRDQHPSLSSVEGLRDSVSFLRVVKSIIPPANVYDNAISIPESKSDKLENIVRCLHVLTEYGDGCGFSKINAEDIVNGETQQIVDLVIILSRFMHGRTFPATMDKTGTHHEFRLALLLFCKSRVKECVRYYQREKIQLQNAAGVLIDEEKLANFTTTWSDGVAFWMLVVHARMGHHTVTAIDQATPAERAALALEMASTEYECPKLLAAADVCDSPDENCTMIYLQTLFERQKAYLEKEKGDTAGKPKQWQSDQDMIEKLKAKVDAEELANRRLQEENRQLRAGTEDLQTELAPLRRRMAQLQEENQQLRKVIDVEDHNKRQLVAARSNVQRDMQMQLERMTFERDRQVSAFNAKLREIEGAKDKAVKEAMAAAMQQLGLGDGVFDAVEPPKGHVTMMFTDIQGSTRQWEKDGEAMAQGLAIHNKVFRHILPRFRGYEVKTEGDAFMVAFPDTIEAVRCAMTLQKVLLECEWPPALLTNADSVVVRSPKGVIMFRGLRVRMGLHCGNPKYIEDPTTHRMDYFGPVVNWCARIESAAVGGQIMVSQAVVDIVKPAFETDTEKPEVLDTGLHELKGVKEPVRLYMINPPELVGRPFSKASEKKEEIKTELDPEGLKDALKEGRAAAEVIDDRIGMIEHAVVNEVEGTKRVLQQLQQLKDVPDIVTTTMMELVESQERLETEVLDTQTSHMALKDKLSIMEYQLKALKAKYGRPGEDVASALLDVTKVKEEWVAEKTALEEDVARGKRRIVALERQLKDASRAAGSGRRGAASPPPPPDFIAPRQRDRDGRDRGDRDRDQSYARDPVPLREQKGDPRDSRGEQRDGKSPTPGAERRVSSGAFQKIPSIPSPPLATGLPTVAVVRNRSRDPRETPAPSRRRGSIADGTQLLEAADRSRERSISVSRVRPGAPVAAERNALDYSSGGRDRSREPSSRDRDPRDRDPRDRDPRDRHREHDRSKEPRPLEKSRASSRDDVRLNMLNAGGDADEDGPGHDGHRRRRRRRSIDAGAAADLISAPVPIDGLPVPVPSVLKRRDSDRSLPGGSSANSVKSRDPSDDGSLSGDEGAPRSLKGQGIGARRMDVLPKIESRGTLPMR